MKSTHTYAVMEVSQAVFDEVANQLKEAGYGHAFDNKGKTIDMSGIALEVKGG